MYRFLLSTLFVCSVAPAAGHWVVERGCRGALSRSPLRLSAVSRRARRQLSADIRRQGQGGID